MGLGFGDLGKMAKVMKNMGKIQKSMEEQQSAMDKIEVTGKSGAGACELTRTKNRITNITITDEAWQSGKEVCLELIIAAFNDTAPKIQEVEKQQIASNMGNILGDLGIQDEQEDTNK